MMAAKFILIVLMTTSSGAGLSISAPFYTAEACEVARTKLIKSAWNLYHAQCHWTGL